MEPESQRGQPPLENTVQLVGRAKHGAGEPAWATLFEKLKSRLASRFRGRKLPPHMDYGDLEGEVVAKVFKCLDSYEPQEGVTFWHWVSRIGENTLTEMWRRHGRVRHGGGRVVQPMEDSSGKPMDIVDQDPLTVTSRVREGELREAMLQCLNEVPPHYAEVLRIRLLEEVDHADIARRLGSRMPPSRVCIITGA
jgi:RNA polymerase sigma factor (sigma-70 family)